MGKAKVAIIMGSDSDYPVMKEAGDALKTLGVEFVEEVVSAHRTPDKMMEFSRNARKNGFSAIVAGAGGAAHLPGMVAAVTELPVIGVPVPVGTLQGEDSLLSIVQMPKGVPVATVAIGNAFNAGLLAAQICAVADSSLMDRVLQFKKDLEAKVEKKTLPSR